MENIRKCMPMMRGWTWDVESSCGVLFGSQTSGQLSSADSNDSDTTRWASNLAIRLMFIPLAEAIQLAIDIHPRRTSSQSSKSKLVSQIVDAHRVRSCVNHRASPSDTSSPWRKIYARIMLMQLWYTCADRRNA